jgi:hypothetical protein
VSGPLLTWASPVSAAPFETIRTNQPGWTVTWEGRVEFLAPRQAPVPARTNQLLNFGDALQTLVLSRAVVRLQDWSDLRLKDRTRLEISVPSPSPGLKLHEGEIYFTSRGGPQAIPVETPHARGVPKGTEFLVRVDAARTEVTMFDGEVELSTGLDTKPLRSGQQGVAIPGQPIQIRPILEAQNIVQWWIYYPAVLDPDEMDLTPAEQTALAGSLVAYRNGSLLRALEHFPGYPAPADPGSDAQRFYLAALLLAIGGVERAEALLAKADPNAPAARALRTTLAAVTPSPVSNPQMSVLNPTSASELLALSYAYQATNNLKAALAAARAACSRSSLHEHKAAMADSSFGFAWARVAELEFSFGDTRAARLAVERALELSPENAQAHAVRGFLLAADYKLRDAIAAFDQAIAIDPALGNAWLGRGLCKRRLGWWSGRVPNSDATRAASLKRSVGTSAASVPDWLSDLQTAAALEPRRSIARSYAGKAFSEAGQTRLANKEFRYARQLDSNDPTPWLYSALELWQENRVNEAVGDLDRSLTLNDNRAVYRSRLLLDQDAAVRRASLAKIYQSAGLNDVALHEAARAVSYDYANPSAHQFLAESYNVLRDPTRFNLRYETIWFNELLLANLLSPAGAGLLSQNISQQEYSRLFEANRLGLLSSTEYRSDGQFREIASQYGLLDRFSYTLDLDYQHNDGTRPNNDLDRLEWYSQLKYQLNDRDSAFLLTKYQDYESGDNFQHYDPASASRQLRFTELQAPIVLGALHREWNPGTHTTLLGGWLHSDVEASGGAAVLDVWTNNPPPGVNWVRRQSFNSSRDTAEFTASVAELNQVWQGERHVTIAGGRFQSGGFDVHNVTDGPPSLNASNYYAPPIRTGLDEPFHRWSVYGYQTFEIFPSFRLTTGLAYDYLDYPANFRFPPLSDQRRTREALLPKAALQWDLRPNLTLRGIYAQSLGGLTYDESVRLEPTQLAGFPQAFRNIISEAEVGSVTAPRYDVGGLAVDANLPTGTFLGWQAQWLRSDVDQTIGIFRSTGGLAPPPQATPSSTAERLNYEEPSLLFSANQLLGREWSLGAGYQLTYSRLRWSYPEIPASLPLSPDRIEEALLHRFTLRLQYQHPSGGFARAESNWFLQDNDGYGKTIYSAPRPGDSVYQLDLFTGWRFLRRRSEVTFGCLNVTGQNYRLNSLTPYPDLPRERVWLGRMRFNF